MLGWALTFLIVALIAAVLGFGGIAGFAVEIAKIIFFVAIILFVISAIFGLIRGRTRPFRKSTHWPKLQRPALAGRFRCDRDEIEVTAVRPRSEWRGSTGPARNRRRHRSPEAQRAACGRG